MHVIAVLLPQNNYSAQAASVMSHRQEIKSHLRFFVALIRRTENLGKACTVKIPTGFICVVALNKNFLTFNYIIYRLCSVFKK